MCYEPLRFSPIFRRFVNSRESRVGFTADSSQPHNQKRLCSRTIVFVLWCVLDCFTQSRAFPQTTPPSLCILHTLSTKQNTPLISSTTSRLEVPSRGLPQKPNSRTASGCRSHAYSPLSDISRSSSTLEGVLSSAFVFVSLSSLSRSRSRRLSRWRQRFISSTAKQRKSESLSASLVSSLSLSSCVSSLACQARERARALPSLSSSFRLAVSHPITGTRLKGPRIAKRRLD